MIEAMLRIIVHIGSHKTGTTSIQHYLRDNRDALLERGLYVPDAILGDATPSHYLLGVACLDRDRMCTKKLRLIAQRGRGAIDELRPRLRADLRRILSDARSQRAAHVVFSAEDLYLLRTAGEYRRLDGLFDGHVVKVVSVFRDLASFKRSYRRELLKHRRRPSHNPDSYRYIEDDSWLFDIAAKRQALEQVFGNRVRYLDYDRVAMVERFMDAIGYPVPGPIDLRLNVTPGTEEQSG